MKCRSTLIIFGHHLEMIMGVATHSTSYFSWEKTMLFSSYYYQIQYQIYNSFNSIIN